MQGERAGEPAGPDVWETCRELIPAGSVFAFLAEHREALFPAGVFADMYPSPNGRPSLPPQALAATVVLQALHGLSGFQAGFGLSWVPRGEGGPLRWVRWSAPAAPPR